MTKHSNRAWWSPPLLVMIGVAGGFLLAQWLAAQKSARFSPSANEPTWPEHGSQPHPSPDMPLTMPSARLGATEEQINRTTSPDANPAGSGKVSVAGAAYDFDPQGITPG